MSDFDFKVINAEEEIQHIVDEIKKYFVKNGNENTKAIIGISGGKDSTIAAALLVRALGSERVIGVMMPNGTQSDIHDSQEVCDILDIEAYTVNIGGAMDALTEAIPAHIFGKSNDVYYTNTPARLRMATLYGVAALVAVGTDHAQIQGMVGGNDGDAHHGLDHGDVAALGQFHQFLLSDAVNLDSFVRSFEGFKQVRFRNFVHFTFHHHDVFVSRTHHNVHVGLFKLVESWVYYKFAVDARNSNF